MPVELPEVSEDIEKPSPPKALAWLVVLLVLVLSGVALTLLLWPKGESTHTAWFWVCMAVFPVVSWCVVFGLRLYYYEQESARQAAEQKTQEEDRAEAIRFAREPLAVLAMTYQTAMGSRGVSASIRSKQSLLSTQAPRNGDEFVRHTMLPDVYGEGMEDWYRVLFLNLLNGLDSVLRELPVDVPLNVRLQLPMYADQERLLRVWNECWQQCGCRAATVATIGGAQGVMALDEWLDIKGGPNLENFTLIVAAQLYEQPPINSGEAAVALLLGWAPLVQRCGMQPAAILHRPVEVQTFDPAGLADAIPKALLWGCATREQIKEVWQAGLGGQDRPMLIKGMADLALPASQTAQLSGLHDIDNALGNPGVVAAWLSIAMAIEHVQEKKEPQLIAARENTLRFAVVHPPG